MGYRKYGAMRKAKREAVEEPEQLHCPPRKRRRRDADDDRVKQRATVILSQRFSKVRGATTVVANEELKRRLTPGLPLEPELEKFRRSSRRALRGR